MRTRFLTLWITAVFAIAAALIVHTALRFEIVRLGYDVGAARAEQRRLAEARRLLAIEAATLRQPARVATVARGALGMETPSAVQVVSPRRPLPREAPGRTP